MQTEKKTRGKKLKIKIKELIICGFLYQLVNKVNSPSSDFIVPIFSIIHVTSVVLCVNNLLSEQLYHFLAV